MAIEKSITVKGAGFVSLGTTFVETGDATFKTPVLYIKVDSVSGDKSQISANVSYTDKAKNKVIIEKSFTFTPDMSGDNFISQAYDHLKGLPEFADSKDC
jgi:hypothetical protein